MRNKIPMQLCFLPEGDAGIISSNSIATGGKAVFAQQMRQSLGWKQMRRYNGIKPLVEDVPMQGIGIADICPIDRRFGA